MTPEDLNRLTRPLISLENRTAQEVFDIMCDRIRAVSLARQSVPEGMVMVPREPTDSAQAHRVCRIMSGDCMDCPASETIGGDECQRGCYAVAVEAINVVETGNPWRKTEGVSAPWTVFCPVAPTTQHKEPDSEH